MTGTATAVEPDLVERLATPYDGAGQAAGGYGIDAAPGGSGFYSTVHDLLQYGLFHLSVPDAGREESLGAETLRQMHTFRGGPDTLFGLGWFGDEQRLTSNGSVFGGNAHLAILPPQRAVAVCLTNMSTSAADEICGAIIEELVPGSSEKTRRSFETYTRLYETPYAPTPARCCWRWTAVMPSGSRMSP